jgi:nucleoside-diphosphate-sugar epimerase
MIFVTGYGGFVGSALQARLNSRSWHVRALPRTARSAPAELTIGDLLAPGRDTMALEPGSRLLHGIAVGIP